jgi:hypothetical protein
MSANSINTTKTHPALRVKPLPVSAQISNPVANKLENINKIITMQNAQAVSDTKYDPDPPKPPVNPQFVEQFNNRGISNTTDMALLLAGSGIICVLISLFID